MCLLFRYAQFCKSLLAFLQFPIAAKTKFLAPKTPKICMTYQGSLFPAEGDLQFCRWSQCKQVQVTDSNLRWKYRLTLLTHCQSSRCLSACLSQAVHISDLLFWSKSTWLTCSDINELGQPLCHHTAHAANLNPCAIRATKFPSKLDNPQLFMYYIMFLRFMYRILEHEIRSGLMETRPIHVHAKASQIQKINVPFLPVMRGALIACTCSVRFTLRTAFCMTK